MRKLAFVGGYIAEQEKWYVFPATPLCLVVFNVTSVINEMEEILSERSFFRSYEFFTDAEQNTTVGHQILSD